MAQFLKNKITCVHKLFEQPSYMYLLLLNIPPVGKIVYHIISVNFKA